ncbi:alpha/beta hydrolase [Erythrobacter sp.]|uniref:alpha/beta fold hydrolase n=1 Tax=Erythrobacter sp. TaxID=1042 RepID=UPI001B01FEA5|nr:alpha/beta hydrolase [Erythrobacter sp.]MBO6527464.1 alpha/beta hydrolase [Erythrobacter sp.]MBO6530847.1 alpha/beta hydrolase [Erythrobacter sp.]
MNGVSYVACQGATVAYRKDGNGPGLVLVHGTGGDSEANWAACAERLAKDWTVVRPDYAGSGATVDDGRRLTVEYLANQVLAAAVDAKATPFHLVGFSLGAAVAVQIAVMEPKLLRSLTLLGGFASSDDARLQLQFRLWRDLIARDRAALAKLILLTGFAPETLSGFGPAVIDDAIRQTLEATNWHGLNRQIDLDLHLNVEEAASRVITRTLVVGHRLDHMVPPHHARRLAKLIQGAAYREIEAGHLAPMEKPELVSNIIADFIRQRS